MAEENNTTDNTLNLYNGVYILDDRDIARIITQLSNGLNGKQRQLKLYNPGDGTGFTYKPLKEGVKDSSTDKFYIQNQNLTVRYPGDKEDTIYNGSEPKEIDLSGIAGLNGTDGNKWFVYGGKVGDFEDWFDNNLSDFHINDIILIGEDGYVYKINNLNGISGLEYLCNIKGPNGDPGRGIISVTPPTSINKGSGQSNTYTINYSDNTTSDFIVYNGGQGGDGGTGPRGSIWNKVGSASEGKKITGLLNDKFLVVNDSSNENGDVYSYEEKAGINQWVYIGNIEGPPGSTTTVTGPAGERGSVWVKNGDSVLGGFKSKDLFLIEETFTSPAGNVYEKGYVYQYQGIDANKNGLNGANSEGWLKTKLNIIGPPGSAPTIQAEYEGDNGGAPGVSASGTNPVLFTFSNLKGKDGASGNKMHLKSYNLTEATQKVNLGFVKNSNEPLTDDYTDQFILFFSYQKLNDKGEPILVGMSYLAIDDAGTDQEGLGVILGDTTATSLKINYGAPTTSSTGVTDAYIEISLGVDFKFTSVARLYWM